MREVGAHQAKLGLPGVGVVVPEVVAEVVPVGELDVGVLLEQAVGPREVVGLLRLGNAPSLGRGRRPAELGQPDRLVIALASIEARTSLKPVNAFGAMRPFWDQTASGGFGPGYGCTAMTSK